MAEHLVVSALQNLSGAIEETPNLMFVSRRRLRRAYADLEELAADLREADSVAKQKKMALSRDFVEMRAAAVDLNRATAALREADSVANQALYSAFVEMSADLNRAAAALAYDAAAATSGWERALKMLTLGLLEVQRSNMRSVVHYISLLRKKLQAFRSMGDLSSSSGSVDLDLGSSAYSEVVGEEYLVGCDQNISRFSSLLTENTAKDSPPRVVGICGMGGLGKTTLASRVFDDSRVRSHFERFAWVEVGSRKVRDVWEVLAAELCSEDGNCKAKFEALKDEEMAKALSKSLKGKRFLVVLDDVWDMDILDRITMVVPEDGVGSSKVLVTTTNQVERTANKNVSLFDLQPLSPQQSWELFKKRVQFDKFVTDCGDEERLTKLGHEMVRHCKGLPLAIVGLGGLLRPTRFKVGKWEEFCWDLKWREEKSPDESGLSAVLNLSYDEMPIQLQQCLLHLAHFPEKYEIRAKEVCKIWIAEGFIPPMKSAEMDAYECLRRLAKRCMVQVRKWGARGRVKTFRIHSFVRDFCLSKAESVGFLHIADFRAGQQKDPNLMSPSSPFRLAIYLNNSIDTELLPLVQQKGDSLRSLMCFNPSLNPYYGNVLKPLFENFCMLRVLKFENVTRGYVGKLPKEIKKMRLLKFLSLRNSHVLQLPSSIGRLGSLQTLDLTTNWRIELPIKMSKLVHLRHLYLPHRSTLKPNASLGLEHLSNLQTLVSVSTKYCDLKVLQKLKNLIKLGLQVHDATMHFEKASETLGRLESLALENCTESKMNLGPFFRSLSKLYKLQILGKIEKFPEDTQQFNLNNLTKLRLKLTRLENDPMLALGKLNSLTILVLDSNSFNGSKMVCSRGSFPRLQSLSLIGLEQLKEWSVEEEAFKNLSYLHINYCYNLNTINPNGVRNVATLKEVVIRRMPRAFKTLLEEPGKEPYILRRITTFELLD